MTPEDLHRIYGSATHSHTLSSANDNARPKPPSANWILVLVVIGTAIVGLASASLTDRLMTLHIENTLDADE